MCTGCHLAPGMKETELRAGLHPKPPNLAEQAGHRSAGETFWIIKHGVKLSGMPAWGVTHDDRSIWGMVALVRKLNELSPGEYDELVARGRAAGHEHGGDEAAEQEEAHAHDTEQEPQLDVAEPAAAAVASVDRFFAALSAGDTDAAAAELDPGVIILESGGAEHSAAEYLGHHAKEDAEFLKGAHQALLRRTARAAGELVWVASESELQAERDGKPLKIASAETMVLRRTDGGWKIVHVHWSSRALKP
jgi:ketosteroid isomerase-like protein